MKSHILLSNVPTSYSRNGTKGQGVSVSDSFLSVWQTAHSNNRRHLLRGSAFQHPHYVQGDIYTGAVRAFWIDSLSAYYPGLLTLSGDVEEAIDIHLLFAALWSRYSSLPERWNAAGGAIDSGLRWWGGRPEFIESTWYLFRATNDAWFQRVGEMALGDIQKRCWTECGWAGLEDVRTGELKDRMESFFLGETAKYLFLLFEKDHPLNKIEAPWVMNTEGHPLLLPKSARNKLATSFTKIDLSTTLEHCQAVPSESGLGISNVASRGNFFHAASLARLHLIPTHGESINGSIESSLWDSKYNTAAYASRSNHSFYPWTYPGINIPTNGTSSRMETTSTFDLSFPTLPNAVSGALTLRRLNEGISVGSVSGLKLGMIREPHEIQDSNGQVLLAPGFRIHSVSHLSLGRDERVLLGFDAIASLNPVDPYFTRHRDVSNIDIVLDLGQKSELKPSHTESTILSHLISNGQSSLTNGTTLSNMLAQLTSAVHQQLSIGDVGSTANATRQSPGAVHRSVLPATVATGIGAGTIPDVIDASGTGDEPLTWRSVYATGDCCTARLPDSIARQHQVIVMKRGGCSFNQKLRNIPSFAPNATSLQLVIVVSHMDHGSSEGFIRPLLDDVQTTPTGLVRPRPIPMVMIEGDDKTLEALEHAGSIGIRRRYHFSSQGLPINNLIVL